MKPKWIIAMAVSLIAMAPFVSLAEDKLPKEGKTTEEIAKAVDEFKGFGQVKTVQFNRLGAQVFALWYCPFSGRGDCYLHAYYFDREKERWTLFADLLVEGSHDLSFELPAQDQVLIFRRTDGGIALKESLLKFLTKEELEGGNGEPSATARADAKQPKEPIVIGPYKPVGMAFDPATGQTMKSHNPLLDQYVGKLVTVRGEFSEGKISGIGDVCIENDHGGDHASIRSLDGKQVECTGTLVKSFVEPGQPVQAVAGTHYTLRDNGPIKPIAQAEPEKKSGSSPANDSSDSGKTE